VLPLALANWVRRQAAAEGIPVAAWLRRLVLEKQNEGKPAPAARSPQVFEIGDATIERLAALLKTHRTAR
jgi:hypothetical protein